MDKKILLFLGMLTLIVNSFGQETTKQKTEKDVPIIVDVELPPLPKYGEENIIFPQKTIPSRTITIEIMNTTQVNANIFYYSPRMENKNYSCWQELGNQDNYLGTTFNNKTTILIPDTCEQGAKLMFHLTGYELLELAMSNVQNKTHISVQLTPKVYTGTIILRKIKSQYTKRAYIKPIIWREIETRPRVLYTDTTQLYRRNGERVFPTGYAVIHNDRLSYYPVFEEVYRYNNDSFKEIYKELKKGKSCSVLLSVNGFGMVTEVEIEGFSNKKNCIMFGKICEVQNGCLAMQK